MFTICVFLEVGRHRREAWNLRRTLTTIGVMVALVLEDSPSLVSPCANRVPLEPVHKDNASNYKPRSKLQIKQ